MTAEFPNGAPIIVQLPGIPQPVVSPLGNGWIYFDQATNQFYQSVNGAPWSPLGGSGVLPPLIGVQFAALMENPIGTVSWNKITQNMISPAFAATLSLIGSSVAEVGQTIANPEFDATYVRPPALAVLSDSDGNPPQTVTASPNPITRAFSYTKTGFGSSETFTLTANESGGTPVSSTASITWQPRVFYGVGLPGQTSAAFIQSLAGQQLQGGRGITFSVNPAAGQAIYYAYPASFGAGTFSVNGFVGGFNAPTTVSVTNAYGQTFNYLLYQSTLTGLGSTTVVVS